MDGKWGQAPFFQEKGGLDESCPCNISIWRVAENGACPHFLSFFLTLILDSRFNIYLDILGSRNFAKIDTENFEE